MACGEDHLSKLCCWYNALPKILWVAVFIQSKNFDFVWLAFAPDTKHGKCVTHLLIC